MPEFVHDGLHFHYQDEGSGIPFIFQHGLGADLTQPFALMPALTGFRRVAFDCRAHGRTRPVGAQHEIGLATFADDLYALLDYLQIKAAVVGGISMGAALTLNFTLRYPERVIGLVQSRPAWLDEPNPWNVMMFTLISSLIRKHGAERGRALFEATPEYREAADNWPDVARSLVNQFSHPDVEQTAFKFERIIKDSPSSDRRQWRSIAVPTLVMANPLDPIHPFAYAEVMASLIPGATLKEITAKSVSVERHEAEVRQHLGTFLDGRRAEFERRLAAPSLGD